MQPQKSLRIVKVEEQDPCESLGLPTCELWGGHRLPAPAEMGRRWVAKKEELVCDDSTKSCTPADAQHQEVLAKPSGWKQSSASYSVIFHE